MTPVSESQVAFPTGDRSSSALLITAEGPAESLANQPNQYRFRVENLTDEPLHNVRLVAADAQNLEFVESDGMQRLDGGAPGWVVGYLGPNESRTITLNASPTQSGQASICMTAQYTPSVCLVTNVIQPALELTMSGPEELLDCDEAVYTLTVANSGVGPARDVIVSANLPDGLRTEDGQGVFERRIDRLEAGETEELSIDATPIRGGQYEIVAEAIAANNLRDDASLQTVVRVPELAVRVDGRSEDYINVPIEYEVGVMNQGDGAALNTVVIASVPPQAAFEAATNNGRLENGQVRWNVGRLAPGEERVMRFAVRGSAEGEITANVIAQAYCDEELASESRAQASTNLTGIPALLLEVVDKQDPVRIGSATEYQITVHNQGSTAATNIAVECFLEEQMDFVNAGGATNASVTGSTIRFEPLPNLPAGETATWTLSVRGVDAGDARFRTQMTADQLTRPVIESESTRMYE